MFGCRRKGKGFLSRESESDIVTGEYGDNSDRDERYWAATQMWRATGEEKYLTAVESIGVQSGMDSANLGDYGNIADYGWHRQRF